MMIVKKDGATCRSFPEKYNQNDMIKLRIDNIHDNTYVLLKMIGT